MNDLVLTPTNARTFFADSPIANADGTPAVSKRYSLVKTYEIDNALKEVGWEVVNYRETRSRGDRTGKGKHMVWYSNPSYPENDGIQPRLIIANTHDKTGSLIAAIGPHVSVCWNGCIWTGEAGLSFRLHHVNLKMDRIINAVLKIASNIPWILQAKNLLSSVTLDDNQSIEYARRAIDLRWDGEKYKVNPSDLISAPLIGQDSASLWDRYQTVQRHLLQGGDFGVQRGTKRRKAQGIKQVAKDVQINGDLWQITKDFAAEQGHELPQLN